MDCGACQPEPGVCGRCGQDPVLDLSSPEVRDMLVEEDARLEQRRGERIRYLAVPASIVLVVAACSAVPALGVLLAVALPFFMGYIVAMIGVAFLLMWAAGRVAPYKKRFPYVERPGG